MPCALGADGFALAAVLDAAQRGLGLLASRAQQRGGNPDAGAFGFGANRFIFAELFGQLERGWMGQLGEFREPKPLLLSTL